ncbi:phosphoenolpyruvate synthase [Hydrogenovibrio marinus]|uniref:Phosphoenolpyruvate synthase n=1 Tax=Hydrogenovibrio marinus TaxID=28885 RepID=A0A066ZXQ7_HYDMR|nr:phosphoenolpyruvate synthase [Hydrogenovibrio marinus]KDN95126.1 phosphoenolpyruvate synthase [Hydrogenovibrio marinus]BBN59599.1 phosphoenolpyruvate synthase [Hydrogenovibrio marinus]
MSRFTYIKFFDEIGIEDIPLVGGKNASLGEMYQALVPQGVLVPNGFAITSEAYHLLINENQLLGEMHRLLDTLDINNVRDLADRGHHIRDLVYNAPLPKVLELEIIEAYELLKDQFDENISLAIRSSATAEDLVTASFAGQQDTYLNIHGKGSLLDACKRCFASLFTDRAIHYRVEKGFDHFDVGLSIGVQKMVRSDLAASGVMFSLDTESGFRDTVFITGAFGLGENVVQGAVDPDEFYVHKPTYEQGYRHILRRHRGAKSIKMIYSPDITKSPVRNIPTSSIEQKSFCIQDDEVLKLAEYAIKIEKHYSKKAGYQKPMDMEWAKDGLDGKLYIVQARPETVASQTKANLLETYHVNKSEDTKTLVTGRAVGSKVAQGKAHVIRDASFMHEFKAGEILVSDITTPDWEPVMKIASAIVTNRGGRTCHAAIIARELGIPAIVGCQDATEVLINNPEITVSCAEGDTGNVYEGSVPFDVMHTDLSGLPTPKTEMMLNIANPDLAFKTSFLPNQGVGLARMEFIINESIKVHPLALLNMDKIESDHERQQIIELIDGHASGRDFFLHELSEGIGTIAAAFYPKPVVVRLSDFKSNEYASLLGGRAFEPKEENPMIGFRGASRYISEAFEPAFALECQAIKTVRERMGLNNVIVMIPFVRRVKEAEQVLEVMKKYGLSRTENGLKVYMMCEIPNNVIEIDHFAPLFDGISIGSNDLTQLVLGVDRDSELVAYDYDERDQGVKTMIKWAIEGAKRNGLHSGICGQAPSDYPEMAEFLVELGADSMSLNPDSILKTTQDIIELEKRLNR